MSENDMEERLSQLEQQLKIVMGRIGPDDQTGRQRNDWRKSLGMFTDRPLMKEIDEQGRRIRQQDREQVIDDHP